MEKKQGFGILTLLAILTLFSFASMQKFFVTFFINQVYIFCFVMRQMMKP